MEKFVKPCKFCEKRKTCIQDCDRWRIWFRDYWNALRSKYLKE